MEAGAHEALRGVWELWRGKELVGAVVDAEQAVFVLDDPAHVASLEEAARAWHEAFPEDPWGGSVDVASLAHPSPLFAAIPGDE